MKTKKWYKIQAKSDEVAEISIFGDIGDSFWSAGVTPDDFKKEFDAIRGSKSIKVFINSYGGDVFDGFTIYNIIASERPKVSVEVLGIAASAASAIALAGSSLLMREGSFFMIHNAWGMAMGPADEMRKMAEVLDKISGELISLYENHSDLDEKQIRAYMDDEKWFTAAEAVEAGFADEIGETVEAAASIAIDTKKYAYKHVPAEIAGSAEKDMKPPETIRDLEAALRDLGYSKKESVMIAAAGFEADRRDSEPEPDQRDSDADVVETERIVDPCTTLKGLFSARKIEQLKDRLSTRGIT